MVAYLATSTFGHLYRKIDCTAADIGALRKAIYSRTVSIPLGLHNLEEIVLARPVSPQALAAQLRLVLSISNWRALLKPCGQLLTDDLRSFAAGEDPASPFLRGTVQNAVTTGITELLESDGEEINEDFAEALDEAKREREEFAAGIRESLAQFEERLAQPAAAGTFEEYFRHNALEAVAALAERAGVGEQCKRRGLHALFAVKSVRMWAGATLSLARARSLEGRSPSAEDLAEVLHAVTGAAAADTFVTADARALPWLSRVAIYGLQTTDLRSFLIQAVQPPPASADS
jgi:hypothetical protein